MRIRNKVDKGIGPIGARASLRRSMSMVLLVSIVLIVLSSLISSTSASSSKEDIEFNDDLHDLANWNTGGSCDSAGWEIEHSADIGYDGAGSVKMVIDPTDTCNIWIFKEFEVEPDSDYEIDLSFYFLSDGVSTGAPVQLENLIIYAGESEPEIDFFANDMEIQKDENEKDLNWIGLESTLEASSDDDGILFIAIGIGTESDSGAGIYIDDISIDLHPESDNDKGILESILGFLESMGILHLSWGNYLMIMVGMILIALAIVKEYEPLLLLPIGVGVILANIVIVQDGSTVTLMDEGGILHFLYKYGIKTGIFPLLIFLGIGSLIDFGPLIANPKTALLGAAAQFGIFATLIVALLLNFSLAESASIGIIGGADGPTAIYTTTMLAPHLLGPIAVAAYSYMALVPIIQPPIMRALTTKEERAIVMKQLRPVSRKEKIIFPIAVILMCALIVPTAVPLIGMLMFGNLMREAGVVRRLSDAAGNEMINVVTIFLGISVGATMSASIFIDNPKTILIFVFGMIAFALGTVMGLVFGKIMCKLSNGKVNPLIGAAGVSAVPMAARVVQKVGREENPHNHLLMHAMGPNVAGVIGSAVAAGVLIAIIGV